MILLKYIVTQITEKSFAGWDRKWFHTLPMVYTAHKTAIMPAYQINLSSNIYLVVAQTLLNVKLTLLEPI